MREQQPESPGCIASSSVSLGEGAEGHFGWWPEGQQTWRASCLGWWRCDSRCKRGPRVAEIRTPHRPVWVATGDQCPAQQRPVWTGDHREPGMLPGCSDTCSPHPNWVPPLEGERGDHEVTKIEVLPKVGWEARGK